MSVKDINIKNRTYYFFNDIIYIENFGPSNIKIDKKLFMNILYLYIMYYIGHGTIKKDLKIYRVNPLYFIFGKVNEYSEVVNGNKYLTLGPTNESKEKIKNYKELWIKIRDLISPITKKLDDHDEKYMNIKIDSQTIYL